MLEDSLKQNFVEVRVEVCEIDCLVLRTDVGMTLQKGAILAFLEIIIIYRTITVPTLEGSSPTTDMVTLD